ncbi:3'-5' exonuclease [Desulfobacterales bacterium HSG2]|nr:3'-5' exonuclease [Desulfobacterales bacterium HSG2]
MNFRIADTFTDSLAKLTDQEQKTVKTTAFDLQMNPAHPSMKFHKLEKARDPNFWSVRVNIDIRLIVHKTASGLLLCYVDHHDDAYKWAERRKLEIHPKTGAAQLVKIREMVREIPVPKYVAKEQPAPSKPLLFDKIPEDDLLNYGIPVEWMDEVYKADEDTVLEVADHLPSEAAEALLELATGGTPKYAQPVPDDTDPFDHPDALRRFRVMNNIESLKLALKYPWDKWTVFLHPEQKRLVEKNYNGPVRISGSAGTGKTIVALHRAVFLARTNPDSRVLLTTFSDTLARALATKMKRLISHKPRIAERLEIHAMNAIGTRLYKLNIGKPHIASARDIQTLVTEASQKVSGHKFSQRFLISEWADVVDAWQLKTWEAYRDVKRLGRKTRLPEKQRLILWEIFSSVCENLRHKERITHAEMFTALASWAENRKNLPFDFLITDEAQDLSIAQLRFLAAMGAGRPDSLFFAGDIGQRIFQQPFSWKALGINIRGRSRTLQINYRTSHQIRMQADLLLGPELSDVDGNREKRNATISVFNGPKPAVMTSDTPEDEIRTVSRWLSDRSSQGIMPHEIGVFVRSAAELDRGCSAVKDANIKFVILDKNIETRTDHVSVSTMHLAKGLEFRAVVVMACDDEVIPLEQRIETAADETDLEEVYNTERHLLYVACTRARDHLLVTGTDPGSEFLDDLSVQIMGRLFTGSQTGILQ